MWTRPHVHMLQASGMSDRGSMRTTIVLEPLARRRTGLPWCATRKPATTGHAGEADEMQGPYMCGRTATTHDDASPTRLLTHCSRGNTQLGTDLAQAPTLGVQVGCALNVHRATVKSLSRIRFPIGMLAGGRLRNRRGAL
jgi:hypothetical protein